MGWGQKLGCPVSKVVIEGRCRAIINTLAVVGGRGILMGEKNMEAGSLSMALVEHINLTMRIPHEMNGGTLRRNGVW